ncbi:MAG: hypothetical protein P4L64_15245 [Caulobacteraceae bacterium]|nr:hypothetical protein [Caulobacteraceae bacterium]
MACSPDIDERADAGFATPAAAVVSLGLAVVASALTGAAVTQLRAARSDAARTQAEYLLDGLQAQAGLAALSSPKATRLAWTIAASSGAAEILAESESAKLGLAEAPDFDGTMLAKLGVTDAGDVRRRVSALTPQQAVGPALEAADAAPQWRACARSLISAYGMAKTQPKLTPSPPTTGAVVWRIGEVWRIRVTASGWADDRIVRFTGDLLHPAAVVDRRFYRRAEGRDRCEALFAAS